MRNIAQLIFKVVIGLTALTCAQSSFALDVQLFRPVPGYSGGTMVYGSGVLPERTFGFDGYGNWTHNPIEFGINDDRIDDIVNHFVSGNFGFSYGLKRNFTIGVDIPVGFLEVVEPLAVSNAGEGQSVSMGDIQFQAIYQFSPLGSRQTHGWGFALIPYITAPTGRESTFFGQANVTGGFRFAADKMVGKRNYFNFNTGFRFREKETHYNLTVGQEMFAAGGYQLGLWLKHHFDFFVEMYGSTTFDHFMSEEISSPMETYLGFQKKWPESGWLAKVGIGRGMNNGYGAPDIRVFGGLSFQFGLPAKEPPVTALGNLVVMVRFEDGTPAMAQIAVTDEADKPEMQETTSDLSTKLAPKKYKFIVSAEGYFPARGIVLIVPNLTTKAVVVLKKQLGTKLENIGKVLFDLDKATIKDESHAVLDEVVGILKNYPEVKLIRVEAHTDGLSSEEYNLKLSERRAKSVVEYLVAGGIEAARVTSAGLGESRPIATNSTKEGRALNRRVEFVLVEVAPEMVEVKEYAPTYLYNMEKSDEKAPSKQ